MKRVSFVCALILLSSAPVFAQSPQTGLPLFGSFQSAGFDTVNLQNLNSNFSLPILSVPGRGTDFGFSVVYDSLVWTKVTVGSTTSWAPVTDPGGNPIWGWKKDTYGGHILYKHSTTQTKCFPDGEPWYWSFIETYSGYQYIDPSGTTHSFGANWRYESCHDTTTATWTATDYSGYFIDIHNLTAPFVISPGGVKSPSGTSVDTNGNLVTKTVVNSSENDWTDTGGHIVLKVITNSNSLQYQYQDPTSAYQMVTLNLQTLNIKTNFACSGVVEYNGTASLPASLQLPNGKSYTFTYEATPGYSGYYTGRVRRVTLPTGGYYEFQYPGANDSINCSDGSITSLTRVVNDGSASSTWQFTRTGISGLAGTTKITAPLMPYDSASNETTVVFDSYGNETTRKIYQGSTTGTLLRTITTTWSSGTPYQHISILEDNSTQAETDTTYASNGNLVMLYEYDWGSGTRGPLIRSTVYTYLNSSDYTLRNIVNRLTQVKIADSTALQYRQDITYDEDSLINAACPTGAAQHDDTNYACTFKFRGNPTSITTYLDPVTPANGVTKNLHYDWFGNVIQADVNSGQQKQWSYSGTTQYAYPDSILSGPSGGPQLTAGMTYNPYTGQTATTIDENNQVTQYGYDYMKRLTTVTRPDNVQLTTAYDDNAWTITTTTPITASSSVKAISYLDGLVRAKKTVTADSGGTSYSIVETQFDPLSRAYKTSNPHNSTAQYWTTSQFDALGRATKVILPDNKQTTFSYSGKTATVTDSTGKQRKTQSDGLGRAAIVYEPDVNNGNQLTQQTTYSYTVLDALAQVVQGVQTRTYGHDALGRNNSVATPEAGTFSYQYNQFYLVTQRTDARGVITTYTYDTLNRPYQIIYNVGSTGVPATPTVTYTYGTNPALNNNGRLQQISDGVGSESYSYDILGRVTQVQKIISGTTYNTGYAYNLASQPTSITYPSSRTVQQSYDAIGRLCAIAGQSSNCSSNTTPYATSLAYNTAFQVTGFNYGNGVAATLGYSSDRLQLTSLSYVKSGQTLFSLGYGYAQNGGNNGQITSITDNVDSGRSAAYTYDALMRLSTASTTGSTGYPRWGLSFTYDRYGSRTAQNLTAGTAPAPQTPTDPATNHMTGYTYDANGNLTVEPYTPSNNNYGYDGENRMVSFSSGGTTAAYTYDAKNLRVKKQSSGATTVYIFSGQKVVAEYVNGAAPGSPTKEYVYAGAQLLATIASGTTTYHHPDHLSARLNSNASGTKVGDQGHFPFGESWYLTNTTTKWEFTSYERDSETGNDYALARYHMNRVGRFSSPDPIGGSSGDPQTWNRYAYVANRPLSVTDPSGMLMCLDPEKGNCGGGGIAGGSGDGSEGGGCAEVEGCDGFADFPGLLAGAGGVCFAGVCIAGNLAGLGTLGAVFNGVVNADWSGLFPPIPGYNAPPIFDADSASACLNGAGPLAVGQSRCAANNGLPGVPKPPNPILQYDKCAANVRSQAAKAQKAVTIINGVSVSNAIGLCGLTGPDAPGCVGVLGGVAGVNSLATWAGFQQTIYDGETQCLQVQ